MTPYKPLMDVQQVTRPLEIRETSPVRKKQDEVLLARDVLKTVIVKTNL